MAGRGHSRILDKGLSDTDMTETGKSGLQVDGIHVVASVDEALAYLAAHRGNARLIAGGTQLMPLIERGVCDATFLVDVSRVCSMQRIVQDERHVVIGGSVTLAKLAENPIICAEAPVLRDAALAVEGESVRAMATLVGHIVAAEGSAPVAVALVALDAEAQIDNLTGSQWMPVDALYVRSGVSRVDSTSEIVTAVRFPRTGPGVGTAMGWIERPEPGQPSPLIVALALCLSSDHATVRWGSVAIGSPVGIPMHVRPAEEALTDAPVGEPDTRERLARLVAAAGTDAMGVDEASRTEVRATTVGLAQRCYDQALGAAMASDAAGDGDASG
jgi:carbon-monoxide dehydrogenase medium subunit